MSLKCLLMVPVLLIPMSAFAGQPSDQRAADQGAMTRAIRYETCVKDMKRVMDRRLLMDSSLFRDLVLSMRFKGMP